MIVSDTEIMCAVSIEPTRRCEERCERRSVVLSLLVWTSDVHESHRFRNVCASNIHGLHLHWEIWCFPLQQHGLLVQEFIFMFL